MYLKKILIAAAALIISAPVWAQQNPTVQQKGESLMLDWPDNEHWQVGSNQKNEELQMLELIPENETLQNWTEMGNMMSIKGVVGVPVDAAMNMMYEQAKQASSKAKLTFIEKDEKAEYPWILFTIESESYDDGSGAESQLWYIVQGKTALYANFRAVKKASISKEQKEKWVRFFKTAKVVNR